MAKYIPIGFINKAIGLKGKVQLFSAGDAIVTIALPLRSYLVTERWTEGLCLRSSLPKSTIERQIINIKTASKPNLYQIAFEDIKSRDAADDLVNHSIYLPTEVLPTLAQGELYSYQLVGLEVYDTNNRGPFGKTISIQQYHSQTNLTIEIYKPQTSKRVEIPFIKKFIKETDLTNKKLYIAQLAAFLSL